MYIINIQTLKLNLKNISVSNSEHTQPAHAEIVRNVSNKLLEQFIIVDRTVGQTESRKLYESSEEDNMNGNQEDKAE